MDTVPCNVVRAATQAALKSKSPRFKHGAVIYRGRRIISTGYNQSFKTHPRGSGPFSSLHAEISAIVAAKSAIGNSLHKCKIFVIRVNSALEIRNSKPCADCMSMINEYNMKPFWSCESD